jgi:hypothetical protein
VVVARGVIGAWVASPGIVPGSSHGRNAETPTNTARKRAG